jgi:tetratricopeptide (TPR) repeat protein
MCVCVCRAHDTFGRSEVCAFPPHDPDWVDGRTGGTGETLAMRGLTLNCMDRKKEAYEHVRLGLKKNMMSHVCWHVYGLLYRSDRDYKEAIKCYKQALKRDKDNGQILRDLSLLQIQMRELGGFAETRRQLLTINPKNRNNWIGFTIAQHYQGEHSMALKILEAYEGTLEEVKHADYEHSEMLLYKAQILEEQGNDEATLAHLDASEPLILDKLSYREKRGELLLKLGRAKEAEELYRQLLAINSDNKSYHDGLLAALGHAQYAGKACADDAQQAMLEQVYADLALTFPRSNAVKRMPLNFLSSARFAEAFRHYVKAFLRKGVPSLFSDIKPLYKDASKAALIGEVMEGNLARLRAEHKLVGEDEVEPPVTVLWVLEFMANHYDRMGDSLKALDHINQALDYTPTVIDLHLTKARIYKHAGDLGAASDECETARKLDLADRFLNTMSTRYALRADRRALAESTVMLFTKDGENTNNLMEMQCMWYEIEFGRSCLRSKAFGKALKKLRAVHTHFIDMVEDQFDFHTYCLRKMTLRAYVMLLRCEDTIYKHKFFRRAALSLVDCYMALHDKPDTATSAEHDPELEGKSDLEIQKILRKRKKAAAKAADDKDAAREGDKEGEGKGKKGGDAKKRGGHKEDEDPDGELLAKVEAPLEEATKYMELLQEHSGALLETQLLAVQLYTRKGRFLKCLQAMKRAAPLAPKGHPALHRALVRFLVALQDKRASLNAAVDKVVSMELAEAGKWGLEGLNKSAAEYAADYTKAHAGTSISHAVAAAWAVVHISAGDEGKVREAEAVVAKVDMGPGVTLVEALDALTTMRDELRFSAASIQAFCAKARGRFPLATPFAT